MVLEFDPHPAQDMLVACLWNVSKGADNGTDPFTPAASTDASMPEVAAAGPERCIVPIKPDGVDAWFNPDKHNLAVQFAILDDRVRPCFEHHLAA